MTYHAPPPPGSDSADEIATGLAMLARIQRHRLDAIADYRRCVIRWEVGCMALCAALAGGALALAVAHYPAGTMRWVMLGAAAGNVVTIGLSVASLRNRLRACALDAKASRIMLAELERAGEDFAQAREGSPKTLPVSVND